MFLTPNEVCVLGSLIEEQITMAAVLSDDAQRVTADPGGLCWMIRLRLTKALK